MEKTISCGRVAHLRLQSVLPLCRRAINHYNSTIDKPAEILINEKTTPNVYAWIDGDLFIETLSILFKDLQNCPSYDKSINVTIKRIGSSTCRILISCSSEISLTECEGPFLPANCPCHDSGIDDAQMYIARHGGLMQLWKVPHSSVCLFEINLLCMSKNGEPGYASLEE